MTRLAFPFGPTALGRSAAVPYGGDAHARQMLELLVFTLPGERVMRPDLGSPALQMVFASIGGPAALALEAALHAAIQQWLGGVLTLLDLTVTSAEDDAALDISITYEISATRRTDALTLRKELT